MFLKSGGFFLLILTLYFAQATAQTVLSDGTRIDSTASPASVKLNRERGQNMLREIKNAIRDNYFDKNFRGIDLEKEYDKARDEIKGLETNSQIFGVIAAFVLKFNDSHTRFFPPGRANRPEYGFRMQMIGDQCFAVGVLLNGPATEAGLREGDRILQVGPHVPTRNNLWIINYILYSLSPQEKLEMLVSGEDGKERRVAIKTRLKSIKEREKEQKEREKKKEKEELFKCYEFSEEVVGCKLETFVVKKEHIDKMMKFIEGHPKLILDLRGNGGGYVKIEEYLLGHFFDRDVKIGDFVTRTKTEKRIAKTRKKNIFAGELIVLIDSESASASEVFARVIQLEKRGRIIGDISRGAVMTSVQFSMANIRGASGFETFSIYGMNLTIADLIMSDGNRLEDVGVLPDLPIGPSQYALANKNDPILAYAVGLFGAKITEREAGELHFLMPKTEDDDDEKASANDDTP